MYNQEEGIVMKEQLKLRLKLHSFLDHDAEPIREKTRKKISKKERIKCGNFIADKDGVKKILENIRRKDINSLDRFKVKKLEINEKGGKNNERKR